MSSARDSLSALDRTAGALVSLRAVTQTGGTKARNLQDFLYQRPSSITDLKQAVLTPLDQHGSESLLLVRREGDDACEVVVVVGDFLFAEEAQGMVEGRPGLRQDVEEEAGRLEEDVFVVDEQFPQQAQILAIEL